MAELTIEEITARLVEELKDESDAFDRDGRLVLPQ